MYKICLTLAFIACNVTYSFEVQIKNKIQAIVESPEVTITGTPINELEQALKSVDDVNRKHEYNGIHWTFLTEAVRRNITYCRILIEHKADVNLELIDTSSQNPRTPLFIASKNLLTNTMFFLLDMGAIPSQYKFVPFEWEEYQQKHLDKVLAAYAANIRYEQTKIRAESI